MKTPDKIKKGLGQCANTGIGCSGCPYDNDCSDPLSSVDASTDALAYIQQLETSYSQVSKALCRKENATWEELLQEVSQVKSRLAQVERERDAAIDALSFGRVCRHCVHYTANLTEEPCVKCWFDGHPHKPHWKWRGVCEENTKGES